MEKVTRVTATEDYVLELTFSTGEQRVFDAKPYLTKGIFIALQDPAKFRQAFVAYDTVCWPGNLDISPATLYDRSQVAVGA
jgi:hypothetical protein